MVEIDNKGEALNILIIRFSALGDLVAFEPFFRAINYFYPNAQITFLTSKLGEGLYKDCNYFEKIVTYDNFFSTYQKLNNSYEIIFNFQCNRSSHFLTLLLKKDLLINKSSNLFQRLFKIKRKDIKLEDMLLLSNIEKKEIEKYFCNKETKKINLKFSLEKYNKRNKDIAISTGASERWNTKKWGVNKYIELISKLIDLNFNIYLVGSASEIEDSILIENKFPKINNLVNKTNLVELKNILAKIDLYIGNDSGPTHIAAAVKTNTITIFGPTDVKHSPKFLPYDGNHMYLKPENLSCHPCYKTTCPINLKCMDEIKVEDVLNKVLILVGEK